MSKAEMRAQLRAELLQSHLTTILESIGGKILDDVATRLENESPENCEAYLIEFQKNIGEHVVHYAMLAKDKLDEAVQSAEYQLTYNILENVINSMQDDTPELPELPEFLNDKDDKKDVH
jgi:hypothetical protein